MSVQKSLSNTVGLIFIRIFILEKLHQCELCFSAKKNKKYIYGIKGDNIVTKRKILKLIKLSRIKIDNVTM